MVLRLFAGQITPEERNISRGRKEKGLATPWQVAFLQLDVAAGLIVRRN
jgi:hypothetical protein